MRPIKFRVWSKSHECMLPILKEDIFGVLENNDHIVMQFTGLLDKNGKEIWEGDIVRFVADDIVFKVGEVIFKDGMFLACHGQTIPENHLFTDLQTYKCEVLGNIFEHPNLLGKENDKRN